MSITRIAFPFVAVVLLPALADGVRACPFCSVESQTLTEETEAADVVVLARLVKEAAPIQYGENGYGDPDSGTATFRVVEVLRGEDGLGGATEINAVYFGEPDREKIFLIMGLGVDRVDWTTPLPLSPAAVDYVRKLPGVPAFGADRIAFFQEYLEHEDPLLAQDAYDEFARTPYPEVQKLGPRMHHDRLIEWITDLEISPSRRRLYFTLLGVCGGPDDLPLLESMIASDFDAVQPYLKLLVSSGMAIGGPPELPALLEMVDQHERRKKLGLDAMVACYLTLSGPDGLDLVDERFLRNPGAEYTHVYSTIMALRFHGDEESSQIPRERLLASMRLLLDNADFADQVILDLSRWDDWSVLDRLVEMFKTADQSSYVRQPVVTYLTVASEQPDEVGARAAAALEELERFDPQTVKQARSLMAFGALGRARAGGDEASGATRPDAEAALSDRAADATGAGADMPDPAAYTQGTQGDSSRQPPAAGGERDEAAGSDRADTVADSATDPPDELNRPLVIGVPLAAAVLLLGIYWLILRAGAV